MAQPSCADFARERGAGATAAVPRSSAATNSRSVLIPAGVATSRINEDLREAVQSHRPRTGLFKFEVDLVARTHGHVGRHGRRNRSLLAEGEQTRIGEVDGCT